MQWLHARIHRAELRTLIAASPILGEQPPEPVIIACPRCGDGYVAGLGPDEREVLGANPVGLADQLDEAGTVDHQLIPYGTPEPPRG